MYIYACLFSLNARKHHSIFYLHLYISFGYVPVITKISMIENCYLTPYTFLYLLLKKINKKKIRNVMNSALSNSQITTYNTIYWISILYNNHQYRPYYKLIDHDTSMEQWSRHSSTGILIPIPVFLKLLFHFGAASLFFGSLLLIPADSGLRSDHLI